MGTATRRAVVRHFFSMRQLPPSRSRSLGERKHTAPTMHRAVTTSARAVPRAAPATSIPAPHMVKENPSTVTVRVGKISRLLNTTSHRHMRALRRLGVRMSPLHWSILPQVCRSWVKGRPQA